MSLVRNVALAGAVALILACADGGGPDTPDVAASTWSVAAAELSADGFSDFLVTFDATRAVSAIGYSFNGLPRVFGGGAVSGGAAISGSALEIAVEWNGSSLTFSGTFGGDGTVALGTISYAIAEGLDVVQGGGSATINRQ